MALFVDRDLVATAEEELFCGKEHTDDFPVEARAAETISSFAVSIVIPLVPSAVAETDSLRGIHSAATHKHIPKITKMAGSEISAVAWPIDPAKDLASATNITNFILHGREHKAKPSNQVSNRELGAVRSES